MIGLVGVNGAGKSTLLGVLAGPRTADARDSHVQSADCDDWAPAAGAGSPSAGGTAAVPGEAHGRRVGRDATQAAAHALAAGAPGADDGYAHALERWLALGGADLDQRAGAVVADLGLTVDLDHAMTALSGRPGRTCRACIAAAQQLRRVLARRAD